MRRKEIDPEVVASRIHDAIIQSPRRSRRLLCHTLHAEFGFQRRNDRREDFIGDLLTRYGIEVTPDIATAKWDEWLVLRLRQDQPSIPPPQKVDIPDDAWFDQMTELAFETERDIELHFVSPLFRRFGYTQGQESAGHPITVWEGVHSRVTQADLVYFESVDHAEQTGNALVLVECKLQKFAFPAGLGQVRSYAYWVKPAYYVVTNGDELTAFLYMGGPLQDKQVLSVKRVELRDRFAELFRILSLDAALDAKSQLRARLDAGSV